MKKNLRTRIAVTTVLCMTLAVLGLSACNSKPAPEPTTDPVDPAGAVEPTAKDDTIHGGHSIDACDWAEMFPNQYKSWATSSNTEYSLVGGMEIHGKIWAGHDAIFNFKAENITLACVGCHSSSFIPLIEARGDKVAETSTEDLATAVTTGITCFSCHGDQPGQMVVVKSWIADAAEKGGITTSDVNLVCAQCHNAPDWNTIQTNSDPSTWTMLSVGTSADAVYDWFLNEGSAAPMVLATENEFTQFYGSTMEKAGATCATCHMEQKTADNGAKYSNHVFTSVKHTEGLWDNCMSCHTDSVDARKAAVAQVQSEYTAALDAATAAVNALGAAIEAAPAGTDVTKATELYNKANFYLIWGTDVAGGVHSIGNQPQRDVLTQAAAFAQEGLDLLK